MFKGWPFLRDIYDLQVASRACGYCTTPLTDSSLVLRCPASNSSAPCPTRFCHRLCLKRSEKTHPVLCPAQNPGSVPLLAFARKHVWMALHALTQCAARLLLAQQAGDDVLRDDWRVYRALAELGMEERAQGGWCAHAYRSCPSTVLVKRVLFFIKAARRRARSRDVAGRTQSLRAGFCTAAGPRFPEEASKIVETAAPEGRRRRAVHV